MRSKVVTRAHLMKVARQKSMREVARLGGLSTRTAPFRRLLNKIMVSIRSRLGDGAGGAQPRMAADSVEAIQKLCERGLLRVCGDALLVMLIRGRAVLSGEDIHIARTLFDPTKTTMEKISNIPYVVESLRDTVRLHSTDRLLAGRIKARGLEPHPDGKDGVDEESEGTPDDNPEEECRSDDEDEASTHEDE